MEQQDRVHVLNALQDFTVWPDQLSQLPVKMDNIAQLDNFRAKCVLLVTNAKYTH